MKELILKVYFYNQTKKLLLGKLIHFNHEIHFEYDKNFTEFSIEISPFHLPLRLGLQTEKSKVFSGLFGVFNDSLPDGWGMLLMDRFFRKIGINPMTASPLERLAYMGDRALGALSYEPCYEIPYKWPKQLNIEILATHCEKALRGKDHEILPELIIAGGSPGGARPKIIVGFDENDQQIHSDPQYLSDSCEQYIVKFPTMIDVNDSAEVEYAYSLMAKDCGIHMRSTRLFNAGRFGNAFAILRFDRKKSARIHCHTLCGLLHADHRTPNLDYIDYLKATWILTQDMDEVIQAYRRMVFNVLTHNRDDHSKNFSFIFDNNKWKLSPAYDLTFSTGIAGEHTMTIDGIGSNPNKENMLNVAKKLAIDKPLATGIIDEIKQCVANWSQYAEQATLNKKVTTKLHKILQNINL